VPRRRNGGKKVLAVKDVSLQFRKGDLISTPERLR
jgi:hypothetical protein